MTTDGEIFYDDELEVERVLNVEELKLLKIVKMVYWFI